MLMAQESKIILVVEDSADIQFLLRQLFESEGYIFQAASNGEEALEFLRSTTRLPNLILLDLMMPVMDGYEFRKRQEQDPHLSKIPVVVMTADGDIVTKKIKVGAQDFIRKPVSIAAMLEVVRKNCA